MTKGAQRRLAAIVSMDVIGYSRLMGADEAGTLAALNAHRSDLIDSKIALHGGRIVKTMGDGLLLEFPSIVNAVKCSIEVQNGMTERNAGVANDRRVDFRIGVNLGDIALDGEDIFGDGVNVAARLQEASKPCGLALSGVAYESLGSLVDAAFEDGGRQQFKNITRPIQVWHWAPKEPVAVISPTQADIGVAPKPHRPSVAVLPFDNMSSDPEHGYFADGMAEDIITALSKIAQMRVIARNSTITYKDRTHTLRQVADELGVRYVLEGSIRSGGSRLRITAQLIDTSDGSHLWAERFDRTIDDIFDIQDEITKEIVTALRVTLTDGEEARLWARGTNDIEAWQLCVRATELFMRFNTTDFQEARELAERAVKRDPNYAYAWATLGFTHWWDGRLGYTGDSDTKFALANDYADRAMALDDTVSWAIGLSTMVAGNQGRPDDGVTIARRGFELYPGNADTRAFLAFALLIAGSYAEAVDHFRAAMALNPFYPNWYRNGLARTLIVLREFDEALTISGEILNTEPAFLQAWLQKAYIFHQIGRMGDAHDAIGEVRRIAPNLRLGHLHQLIPNRDEAFAQQFIDSLREAGMPE